MKTADKITRAKVQLIISEPFFATVMLALKFSENKETPTAATDGKNLEYNPAFIDGLDVEQTKGLIAHEVMHITNLHHLRRAGREPKKWNRACDFAINPLLVDKFKLPEDGCIDKAYNGMSAEEIYKRLPDEPGDGDGQGKGQGQGKAQGAQSPGQKNGNDPGGNGQVDDTAAKTQAEHQKHEAETKQLIAQAANTAKQQGKLPAHLERLIAEMLEPVIDWRSVLSSFLTEIARNDYTWKKPSKRFASMGLYLPSLESVERGKFVLMVDTSGSIDAKLLNQFAGEMQAILSDCAESITVMFIDAELNSIQEFESDEEMNLKPEGGGGTDFKPGFDYLEEQGEEPAAVIYFTDGICNSFPKEPAFPVMWAIHDNKKFVPPFGEKIDL